MNEQLNNKHMIYDCPVCGAPDILTEKQLNDYDNREEEAAKAAVKEVLDEVEASHEAFQKTPTRLGWQDKVAEIRTRYKLNEEGNHES